MQHLEVFSVTVYGPNFNESCLDKINTFAKRGLRNWCKLVAFYWSFVWKTSVMPYVKPGANKKVANLDDGPVPRMIDPQYDRPGCHLEFFLKIQHVHGQKMINPLSMTGQDVT